MTAYRIRQIARMLRTGDAVIIGQATGGDRWPDEPHYWVVQDNVGQRVYHVPTDARQQGRVG